ncbi:MAG: hypothetical protein GDA50_05210 [Alphaproteobacteria bacterium GM202ARS2]|nr:hypothetical protein [Alphaproteobacteria bacterium GM202ARS2]
MMGAQPSTSSSTSPSTSSSPSLVDFIRTPSGHRRLGGYRRRNRHINDTWWFGAGSDERFAVLLTLPQADKRHIFILLALGLKARLSRRIIQAQEIRALKKEMGESYYRFLRLRAPLLAPPEHDEEASFSLSALEERGRRFLYSLDVPPAVRVRLALREVSPEQDLSARDKTHARAFIKRTLQQGESPWLWLSA